MKDLLPDLGEGFITDCLKYYEMDSEQVVNAILEENLPPILSNADRSASTSVELGSSSNSIENNCRFELINFVSGTIILQNKTVLYATCCMVVLASEKKPVRETVDHIFL